jgi:hypothetical protein
MPRNSLWGCPDVGISLSVNRKAATIGKTATILQIAPMADFTITETRGATVKRSTAFYQFER